MANYRGLTKTELKRYARPKRLFISAAATILAFIVLDYVSLDLNLYLGLGLSGMVATFIAEVLD